MLAITIKQVSECLEKYKIKHIVPAECDEIMLYPSNRGVINALLNVTTEQNDKATEESKVIKTSLDSIEKEIKLIQEHLPKQIAIEQQAIQQASNVILPEMYGHSSREYLHNCQWRYSPSAIATNQACQSEKTKTTDMKDKQDSQEKLKEQTEQNLKAQESIMQQYQNQAPVREMLELTSQLKIKKIEGSSSQETEITQETVESIGTSGRTEENFEEFLAYG